MKLPKSKLFFHKKLIRLIKYETVLLMKKTGLKLNETSLVKFHETSEITSGIENHETSHPYWGDFQLWVEFLAMNINPKRSGWLFKP